MATKQDYITQLTTAKIEGFKSIKSVKIDFEPGINVIIGRNASGKSNFIEALFSVYGRATVGQSLIKSILEFQSSKGNTFKWERSDKYADVNQWDLDNEGLTSISQYQDKFYFNGVFNEDKEGQKNNRFLHLLIGSYPFVLYLQEHNVKGPLINFIWYNLPNKLDGIEVPLSISINSDNSRENKVQGLSIIQDKIIFSLELYGLMNKNKKVNQNKLETFLSFNEKVKTKVRAITPIEDFRLKQPIIYSNEEKTTIENIIVEFKIGGEWMPWSWLSDGTKRLFYIVTEVALLENGIVFLEEPELGIHPHQFHQLMTFLKEESKDKQIIISTHSPKTLDILTSEELSHIIIASYDKKKGTQLRHLTTQEQKKAAKYMSEVGYISDYWLYSDLEA